MGILDEVLNGKQAQLTQAEALAGIVVAAAIADRCLSNEEAVGLQASLLRMRLFKGWTEGQFSNLFTKLADIFEKQGANALLKLSADSLAQEYHETAFTLSTDLILADGTVAEQEKNFLSQLQQLLRVEDQLARKIVEVMMIKNRG